MLGKDKSRLTPIKRLFRTTFSVFILTAFILGIAFFVRNLSSVDTSRLVSLASPVLEKLGLIHNAQTQTFLFHNMKQTLQHICLMLQIANTRRKIISLIKSAGLMEAEMMEGMTGMTMAGVYNYGFNSLLSC